MKFMTGTGARGQFSFFHLLDGTHRLERGNAFIKRKVLKRTLTSGIVQERKQARLESLASSLNNQFEKGNDRPGQTD
jgi:hypothetical protein